MTDRRQVWLIAGACLVIYALVMFGFAAAVREPVAWASAWMGRTFGDIGSLVVIGCTMAAGVAWLAWTNRNDTPLPRPGGSLPAWFRYSRTIYLSLLGLVLLGAFAGILIAE